VEISRWDDPNNDVGQFVAQPWNYSGNMSRFGITFSEDEQLVSYAFRWLPDRVEARCWYGGPVDEQPGALVHAWTYTGPHIPRPEQPRVHMNFWQFSGPPSNSADHEVIITDFRFVPSCADNPDGSDFTCFCECLAGPAVPLLASCTVFDQDADQDVDLVDFGHYQAAAGAGRRAKANSDLGRNSGEAD
jgi:hypothetical protein